MELTNFKQEFSYLSEYIEIRIREETELASLRLDKRIAVKTLQLVGEEETRIFIRNNRLLERPFGSFKKQTFDQYKSEQLEIKSRWTFI